MPTVEQVSGTLPSAFRFKYPNTYAIIDGSEIFIETPSDLHLQSSTWSQYKHHNTSFPFSNDLLNPMKEMILSKPAIQLVMMINSFFKEAETEIPLHCSHHLRAGMVWAWNGSFRSAHQVYH